MRPRIVLGMAAVLILGGGTALAVGDSPERRTAAPAVQGPAALQDRLNRLNRQVDRATASVACRTMRCINRNLTRLTNAVSALNSAVGCMRVLPVSQFFGYVYTPDGGTTFFETSALDVPVEGEPTGARVLVYVC